MLIFTISDLENLSQVAPFHTTSVDLEKAKCCNLEGINNCISSWCCRYGTDKFSIRDGPIILLIELTKEYFIWQIIYINISTHVFYHLQM